MARTDWPLPVSRRGTRTCCAIVAVWMLTFLGEAGSGRSRFTDHLRPRLQRGPDRWEGVLGTDHRHGPGFDHHGHRRSREGNDPSRPIGQTHAAAHPGALGLGRCPGRDPARGGSPDEDGHRRGDRHEPGSPLRGAGKAENPPRFDPGPDPHRAGPRRDVRRPLGPDPGRAPLDRGRLARQRRPD